MNRAMAVPLQGAPPQGAPLQGAPLQGEIKKGRASLIGGIAVGIGVMGLWWVGARDLGYAGLLPMIPGAILATVIGAWIRIADL
jgi:uncharacterized membrane protein YfcA